MRPQNRLLSTVLISAVTLACGGPQRTHGTALDGAWQVVAVEVTGSGATAHNQPQPSLVLFSGEYYSWSRVTTTSPRALFVAETPTDAERIAAFDSVLFNAGTYEISDSTLTVWPIVARSPNFMGGASERYRYRLNGDTLWVEQRPDDVQFRLGDRLVSPSTDRVLRMVLQRIR